MPNCFIIIGGQRCGTGWIAQCLREHPDVSMAPDETRFFDKKYRIAEPWWEFRSLKVASADKVIGEKTANYLSDANVPRRIYSELPDVKIVCCLRNPVERFYSAFLMKAFRKPQLRSLPLKQLITEEPDLVTRGYYARHLSRYFEIFPVNNIHVSIYEDIKKAPDSFVQKIYGFVGVDFLFTPGSLYVQTKPGATEYRNRFLARYSRLLFSRKLPFLKIYNMIRKSPHGSHWAPWEKEFLIEIFDREISDVESLLGRSLPEWRS